MIEPLSKEKSRIKRGLTILTGSSLLILVGLAMMLVAFLVVWNGTVSIEYFYINGGFSLLILGAGIFISGLRKRLPALNSSLSFALSGSSYLSVLLVSCLLPLFYPYLTPYCWFLIPVVASFFVGYFVREVETAVKTIIVSLLLHPSIVIGLLMVPSIRAAFTSYFGEDLFFWMVLIILDYFVTHIILGVIMSCIARMVRDHIGELKKLLLPNRM